MSLPFINNTLSVRVIPNAAKIEIVSTENNVVKVRIAAPPDKNKANIELLKPQIFHWSVDQWNSGVLKNKHDVERHAIGLLTDGS